MSIVKAPLQLQYTGMAGEHRIISELLLRGIKVYSAKLDHGIDLMLENGKTIQVKAAHLYHNKCTNGKYYHFSLKEWYKIKDGTRKSNDSEKVDFYIFWCIDIDSFYVIPRYELGDRAGIDLYPATMGASPHRKTKFPRDRSQFNIYKEKWDLLVP